MCATRTPADADYGTHVESLGEHEKERMAVLLDLEAKRKARAARFGLTPSQRRRHQHEARVFARRVQGIAWAMHRSFARRCVPS